MNSSRVKIPWRIVAFGVVAYLIFVVATLPADFVLSHLQSRGFLADGITGSIWNGHTSALQVGRVTIGEVDWRLGIWRFFTGKLSVDLRAKRDDGSFQATVNLGLGKKIGVRQLQGSLPISALGGLGLPGGWQGGLQLNLAELDLQDSWPISARGTVNASNLAGPANQPMQIGSFRVEFGSNDAACQGLVGALSSLGDGPFDANGTLCLHANHTYEINAHVATRGNTPASLSKALDYLPTDEQGKRMLSMSGSF